ncbi:MAG: anaerobic ribonucleoside-triphosphate reductase activating protein [Clostridium sp.]
MKISGLQKTTLLDYPGHVASTVFLGGCNFRCPFCHNSDLLGADAEELFTEESVLTFLKKRSSVLEGICITGGEPTLQPDLEAFIKKVRTLGLSVKLDTNGYRPDVLKSLCSKGLLDYVAMDIKSGKSGYSKTAGLKHMDISLIEESVDFLLRHTVPYEFRTTVVKELHSSDDFREIAPWISGCSHYYIQSYKDSENVLTAGFSACTKEELLAFADIVSPYVEQVTLRGIDY